MANLPSNLYQAVKQGIVSLQEALEIVRIHELPENRHKESVELPPSLHLACQRLYLWEAQPPSSLRH